MVLLASEAIVIAEHALGGEVHSAIGARRCVNEAGEWLVSARQWLWLRGGLEALPLVAAQPYVDLPSNFGTLVGVEGGEGWPHSYIQTTLADLLLMRANTTASTGQYYHCALSYNHGDITGTSTGANHTVTPTTAAQAKALKSPTPRLELYPIPGDSLADGVIVYYTRGWAVIDEADTDSIFLPSWMESIYLQLVRLWARSYEYDVGSEGPGWKQRALMEIKFGPEWEACVNRDTAAQMDLGQLKGGAVQQDMAGIRTLRTNNSVDGPS